MSSSKASDINPNVPKELDQIILKALSRNRDDRFENLDKMNRSLMKFLYTHYSEFNATDLGYFAKELFKEEIKKDRAKLYEYGKIDILPFIDELNNEAKNGVGNISSSGKNKKSDKKNDDDGLFTTDDGMVIENSAMTLAREAGDRTEASRKVSRTNLRNKDSLSISKVSGIGERTDGTRTRARKRPRRTANGPGDRTRTRVRVTGKNKSTVDNSSGGNLFKYVLFLAVGLLGLYVIKPDLAQNIVSTLIGTEAPPKKISEPVEPVLPGENKYTKSKNSESKLVKLQGIRKHRDKVYVNGKIEKPNILSKINIPLKGQVIIRIQREQKQHFIVDLTGKVSEVSKIKVENTPNQSYGFLVTKRNCGIGKVYFNLFGEERVESLPIKKKPGIWIPTTPKEKKRFGLFL